MTTTQDITALEIFLRNAAHMGNYITGNDLICDCSLAWLKAVDGTCVSIGYPASTICSGGPPELIGRKWDTLTMEEMINYGESKSDKIKFQKTDLND